MPKFVTLILMEQLTIFSVFSIVSNALTAAHESNLKIRVVIVQIVVGWTGRSSALTVAYLSANNLRCIFCPFND